MGLVRGRAEQDADPEIEAVEDHVDKYGAGDDRRPEQCKVARLHGGYPPFLAVSAKAIGRLPVAPGMARASAVGPSRSSL